MRLRLLTVATVAALAAAPVAASGATQRPQIRDMKGDARGGLAHVDIVTAQWSTTGRGASKALVATMTLVAPPNTERGFVYEMKSSVRGCGTVWFQYAPGTVSAESEKLGQPAINDGMGPATLWLACGGEDDVTEGSQMLYKPLTFTAKGTTLSWSIPLSALPKQVQAGSVFADFFAVADVAEPTLGTSVLQSEGLDNGRGDGVWILR